MPPMPNPHNEDSPRPENEAFKELRAESGQGNKQTLHTLRAYERIAEALEKVDPAPHELGRSQFISHCEQIHAVVEFYLISRAIDLSTIANGGIFTHHRLARLEEGYSIKRAIKFPADMAQGTHLWDFDYESFYETLFTEVSPLKWYDEQGQLNRDTICDLIEDYQFLTHIETGEKLSLSDYVDYEEYRSIGDLGRIAQKFHELGVTRESTLQEMIMTHKEAMQQHHDSYAASRTNFIEEQVQVQLHAIMNGLHRISVELYEVSSIYENNKSKGLLDETSVEQKIAIAFVLNHRYSRSYLYDSPHDLPIQNILSAAARIGQITMPKEQMNALQLARAEAREEISAYLLKVLRKHEDFLRKYMQA